MVDFLGESPGNQLIIEGAGSSHAGGGIGGLRGGRSGVVGVMASLGVN